MQLVEHAPASPPEDLVEAIGDVVASLRAERSWTQARLAAATGISQPRISQIERGKTPLSLSDLRALARAFDVTPGELLGRLYPDEAPAPVVLSARSIRDLAEAIGEQFTVALNAAPTAPRGTDGE